MNILFSNLLVLLKIRFSPTSNHLVRKTHVSTRCGVCELAVGYLPAHHCFLDPEKCGCKELWSENGRRPWNPALGHACSYSIGEESWSMGGELKACCRGREDSNCSKWRECLLADGHESSQPVSGKDSSHRALKPLQANLGVELVHFTVTIPTWRYTCQSFMLWQAD